MSDFERLALQAVDDPVLPPADPERIRERAARLRRRRRVGASVTSVAAIVVVVAAAWAALPGRPTDQRVVTGPTAPGTTTPRGNGVASSYFASVTCFAPHTCLAVGPQGTNGSAVWATDDSTGQHWSLRARIAGRANDISCGGRGSCAVLAFTLHPLTTFLLWSSDEGRHWQRHGRLPWLVTNARDISCPAPSTCAIAGDPPVGKAYQGLVVTDDAGRHWDSVRPNISSDSVVTCPTARVCYLWGNERTKAAILRYRLIGSRARLTSRQVFPSLGYIWGMGCSSSARCAGITEGEQRTRSGNYLVPFRSLFTTNGGSHWGVGSGNGPSGQDVSWSIACPSARICVAAGSGGQPDSVERVMLRTDNSGRTWRLIHFNRRTPPVSVGSVSCASPGLCVAVGGQNVETQKIQRNIFVSNDSGKHWRSVPTSP